MDSIKEEPIEDVPVATGETEMIVLPEDVRPHGEDGNRGEECDPLDNAGDTVEVKCEDEFMHVEYGAEDTLPDQNQWSADSDEEARTNVGRRNLKRKRIRPQKEQSGAKRGRPRKEPQEPRYQSQDQGVTKRKPGRPRKSDQTKATPLMQPEDKQETARNSSQTGKESEMSRAHKRLLALQKIQKMLDEFDPDENMLSGLSDEDYSEEENTSMRRGGQQNTEDKKNEVENGTAPTFLWSDGKGFAPKAVVFDDSTAGIQDDIGVSEESRELDYFQLFFDDKIIRHIVVETNRNYDLCAEKNFGNPPSGKLDKNWKETSVSELYVLLAKVMLMSHAKKYSLSEYWNKDSLVSTPVFSKYLTKFRLLQLLNYLHFSDKSHFVNEDFLWKIRHIFNYVRDKFRVVIRPFQNLVIDETIVLQRDPSKTIPFNLYTLGRVFVLRDCKTGVTVDMLLYTGEAVDVPRGDPMGSSAAVVKKLLENYLEKGHIIYTDKQYTSPELCKYLASHGTGMCGSVRKGRKDMPPEFSTTLKQYGHLLQESECILAVKWYENHDLQLLTTVHTGKMKDSGMRKRISQAPIYKPDAVLDYKANMNPLNKSNLQIGEVDCLVKSVNMHKRLFFHLVDLAVLNAYNLYLIKTSQKISLKDFSHSLISQLLEKYGTPLPSKPNRSGVGNLTPDRLMAGDWAARHYLEPLPTAQKKPCRVCAHTQRKEQMCVVTTSWCRTCRVALCIGRCFRDYHTLQNY